MASKRAAATLAEHTLEHVKAREAARVATVLPPWLAWMAALGLAMVLHGFLRSPAAAAAVVFLGAALAALALHLTHRRTSRLARLMAPGSLSAAAGWLAWADLAGLRSPWTAGAWFIAGGSLALAWSMWLHIREDDDAAGGIARWLAQASVHTGQPGLRLRLAPEQAPGRITGVLEHPPGVVTADVVKAVPALESAGKIPPGTIKVTAHADRADWSHISLVDAKALREPALYPGPSLTAASIADPLVLGRFTDGHPWECCPFPRDLPGWQALIMGMTGSGKTTGLAYSLLGEAMTRKDAAILAIDTSKGDQYLGCLRDSLHALASTPADARRLLWRVNNARRPRTDYLAARGLHKWEPGCGLSALLVWVEEAAAVFRALGDNDVEKWVLPLVLEARSAGIWIALSLQSAHFSQMPTTVRAQLGSVCMGVRGSDDAQYGLSDDQIDHGCDPARWSNRVPGMAYADYPGLAEAYRFTEARCWYWGKDAAMMTAHAAGYPASARPLDRLTAAHLFPPDVPQTTRPAPAARAPAPTRPEAAMTTEPPSDADLDDAPDPTEYDDPRLWEATADEAAEFGLPEGTRDFRFAPRHADEPPQIPLSAEQARQVLRGMIARWTAEGKTEITMEDLADLTDPGHENYVNRSRQWLYPAMEGMMAEGLVDQHDRPRRWTIRRAA